MSHARAGIVFVVAGTLVLTAAVGPRAADPADTPEATASASALGYLRIEGVQGGATARGYEGWIEVTGLEWGVSNPSAATLAGRTSGQADFNPIIVTKPLDKATPVLAQACAAGRHYREAQLVFFTAGSTTPSGSVNLTDVTVMETIASGGQSAVLDETLALSFGRIEWTFLDIDPATGRPRGEVKAGWDVAANRPM
jgi:type VI secretion system secreted protein Hcp